MQTAYTVFILLLLVAASRILSRFVPFLPLPLVQIMAGAVLAWPNLGLHFELDPELFLFLFLPPLLFSDGWNMPKRSLFQLSVPILMLAIGLVVFTVVGAGYFIHWLIPTIPLSVAFALAAILSPTDAVAVSAITQNKLPGPLMRILQGEALMNDASGLVTFKFALDAAKTGVFLLSAASTTFMIVALGGLGIGIVMSWLLAHLRSWMIGRGWDDPATHVVFLLLLPFVSYVLAEHLGVSGILSAVAAGMMQSWVDLLPQQTSTRLLNRSVWVLLGFSFNGLIFLILGLQLPDIVKALISHTPDVWDALKQGTLQVLLIFLVLAVLRYVWVHGIWMSMRIGSRLSGKPEPEYTRIPRGALLVTVAGVRGAVTLAGVMSIPWVLGSKSFPERERLLFIAAGIILLSIVVASIALPLLLRGMLAGTDEQDKKELHDVRHKIAEVAIQALESEALTASVSAQDATVAALAAEAKARLMSEYRRQLQILGDTSEAQLKAQQNDDLERRLHLYALRAQRLELYRMRRKREIGDNTMRKVLGDLDMMEATLGQQGA